jgi:hypothetical protein
VELVVASFRSEYEVSQGRLSNSLRVPRYIVRQITEHNFVLIPRDSHPTHMLGGCEPFLEKVDPTDFQETTDECLGEPLVFGRRPLWKSCRGHARRFPQTDSVIQRFECDVIEELFFV